MVDGWFVDVSPDYYNFPNTDQHYYVSDDSITLNAYLSLGSKEKLCLHLNGKTLARKTNGARAVAVASNAAFNLMDHADNAGQIQGYAEVPPLAALFVWAAAVQLSICTAVR